MEAGVSLGLGFGATSHPGTLRIGSQAGAGSPQGLLNQGSPKDGQTRAQIPQQSTGIASTAAQRASSTPSPGPWQGSCSSGKTPS